MPYDINRAREAGATDDQIVDYLATSRNYDFKGALNAGATKEQLIEYLSKVEAPRFPPTLPSDSTDIPENQTSAEKDARSAEETMASFPSKTGEGPVAAGLKTVGNVPSSFANLGKNVVTAVLNPVQTFGGILDFAGGATRRALEKVGIEPPEGDLRYKEELEATRGRQDATFDAIAGALKDRYGSLENAQRTATNDPAGFGSDVLSVLGLGAGALGKTKQLNTALSRVGSETLKASSKAASMGVDLAKGITRKVSRGTGAQTLIERAQDLVTPLDETLINTLKQNDLPRSVDPIVSDIAKRADDLDASEVAAASDELLKDGSIDVGTTKVKVPEETGEKLDFYLKQGEEAKQFPKSKTPLEMAGERTGQVLFKLKAIQNKIGKQKSAELQKVAATPLPEVQTVVDGFMEKLADRLNLSLKRNDDGGIELSSMEGRKAAVTQQSDLNLIKSVFDDLESMLAEGNGTLQYADDTVDAIQSRLFDATRPGLVSVNTRAEAFLKSVAEDLNKLVKKTADEKLKEAGLPEGTYSKLNDEYAHLAKLTGELNTKLGKQGERGGALMKRVFSPSDNRTKDMFREIEEITGVDLVEDATFAKFSMEAAGDNRQLNLLEEAGITSGSVKGRIINKMMENMRDPKGKAQRIIKQSKKKE